MKKKPAKKTRLKPDAKVKPASRAGRRSGRTPQFAQIAVNSETYQVYALDINGRVWVTRPHAIPWSGWELLSDHTDDG